MAIISVQHDMLTLPSLSSVASRVIWRLVFVDLIFAISAAYAADAERPNVVFILADDLGWGDLGCYGNRVIRTPNLDRLATQGTLFTQFYVSGSVCSPSRAAFMTGRFPGTLGLHTIIAGADLNAQKGVPNFVDVETPFVPRVLKEAGYATAHFGKWHLSVLDGSRYPAPDAYGIDEYRVVGSPTSGFDQTREFRALSTERIVDETIRFVEAHRNDPFYVNVWTPLPHATLDPTEEQLAEYDHLAPTAVPYRAAKQVFAASVTAIDRGVGRLLERLDELGLTESTLVVFSSDNGPEAIEVKNASHSGVGSTGPFRGRKRSLYEGGVRVPLIVRWPGHVPAGRVDDESVLVGVDWLPTIAALAGAKLPADAPLDGEDVGDILLGQSRARSKPAFWDWRHRISGHTLDKSPICSIRDGKWKLLMNPDRSRIELYDIPADPSEMNNLAAEQPELVARMAAQLLAWRATLPPGPSEAEAGDNAYPWPRSRK